MTIGANLTTAEVPEYLKRYITGSTDASGNVTYPGLLNLATSLGNSPLPKYNATVDEAIGATKNRVASFNPLQEYAFQQTSSMQPSRYVDQAAGLLGLAGTSRYDTNTAQQYMNPYMQNVVLKQKQEAMRDYQRQLPQLGATAWQSGAGRGTRNNLMQAEANRNLQNNMQNIQAKGLQDAWSQGQQQYSTDLNRMVQAGTGLGQIGQTAYDQMMGINKAQQQAGATIQGQLQNILNVNYEDYLAGQRRPYEQLSWLADIYGGVPTGTTTQTMFAPTVKPDIASWIGGMGAAAVGNSRG